MLLGDVYNGDDCFGDAVLFDGHGGVKQTIAQNSNFESREMNDAGTILYDQLISDGGPCEGQIFIFRYPGNTYVAEPTNASDGNNTNNVYGINNDGDVVGQYRDMNYKFGGFYDHDGISQELLYDGNFTYAFGINKQDWIVGYVQLKAGPQAFIWSAGRFTLLRNLAKNLGGWQLQQATRINNAGYIIGTGTRFGSPHGFLLIP